MTDSKNIFKENSKTNFDEQAEHYAVRMYKNVGFERVAKLEEEYLMVCDLS